MGEGHDRHSVSPIHLLTCGLKAWLGFPLEQRALAKEHGLTDSPLPFLVTPSLFASGNLALQPPTHTLPAKKSCRPLAPGTWGSSCGFPGPAVAYRPEEEKHEGRTWERAETRPAFSPVVINSNPSPRVWLGDMSSGA